MAENIAINADENMTDVEAEIKEAELIPLSSAPEPSLKGGSGLLELGWKAAAEENMTVDLNLSGWTGKQRGVMAGVNMQWKF